MQKQILLQVVEELTHKQPELLDSSVESDTANPIDELTPINARAFAVCQRTEATKSPLENTITE